MRRIAVLGGTFNPVHNGHLKLAENAMRQFPLDECWFMPSPNPPHKSGRVITDFKDRFEMVRLALESHKGFTVSDFENRLSEKHPGGKSYTCETLKALSETCPDCRFHFLMGADSLYEFSTWFHPEEIVKYAALIAASRDYDRHHETLERQAVILKETLGAEVHLIRAEQVDISSEHIRALYAEGKTQAAERCLPRAVAQYIALHGLYAERRI